jgi:hypothetical protein
MNLQENINRIQSMMGIITEVRKGWYNLLKQKLPNFPEYVFKDWIYRKVDNYKDYESFLNWIDEFLVDIEWEYEKNFPITMDIFGDKTKKELEERISGLIRTDVENDIIRHQNQKELLSSRGISEEPIILFKTKDGKYELGEGWHRTTQTFIQFPNGFIQPNVYIGLNAKWIEPDFKPQSY